MIVAFQLKKNNLMSDWFLFKNKETFLYLRAPVFEREEVHHTFWQNVRNNSRQMDFEILTACPPHQII